MGRSSTPPFVVEVTCQAPPGCKQYGFTPSSWYTRSHTMNGIKGKGKPTDKKLEDYILEMGKSMNPGGVNAHLSKDMDYIPYPTSAIIRENRPGGTVVARWKAPMFMVW
jgi:hypothetical protein